MSVDMYVFSPAFEAQVVHLLSHNKGFASAFGPHMAMDMFPTPAGRLIWKAIDSIYKDMDDMPGCPEMVEQRIQTYVNMGHVKHADASAAMMYLYDGVDEQRKVSDIAPELTALLKGYGAFKVADETTRRVIQRKSLADIKDLIDKVESIGTETTETSDWVMFDTDIFDWLASEGKIERLRTGITELDIYMKGGFPLKTLTTIIGGSGVGKSFALSQFAATQTRLGSDVLYITLENTDSMASSRLIAPLINMQINDMLENPMVGKQKAEAMLRRYPEHGTFLVKKYGAGHPVEAIREDVVKMQSKTGFKPRMVCFDYIGESSSRKVPGGSAHSRYLMAGEIARALRVWAEEDNIVMLSAAQSVKKQTPGRRSRLTLDDIADSMNIVRVSDNVLTLNAIPEEVEGEKTRWKMCIGIPKHRSGESGQHTSDQYELRKYGLIYPSDVLEVGESPIIMDYKNYKG